MKTNRAVLLFLKDNWIIAILLLLLLWLMPKLVNAWALLLGNARHWLGAITEAPGNLLSNTAKGARDAVDTLLADFSPTTGIVLTAAAAAVTPAPVRIFLVAWQVLDFFKGDERVTVSRTVIPAAGDGTPPTIQPAPQDFAPPAAIGSF